MSKKCTDHYCGIGGQAVLEGVMMKNKDAYAVAVRRPDGKIEIKKELFDFKIFTESITTIFYAQARDRKIDFETILV